jgi:putative ABC transport system permease protein
MQNFKITIKLAWRNVWRNKRRTILTMLTIIAGGAMIIFMNAIAKGGHDQMIEDAIALNVGHIQIHEKGYNDNLTIDYAFQPTNELLQALKNDPQINSFTKRVIAAGMLSVEDKSIGVFIQGIDPINEIQVSHLNERIQAGRYLLPKDSRHIVLGATLAKKANLKVGNEVAIISQGFDGSIAAEQFEVVGIFSCGNPEYDRELALIPIQTAKDVFSMMGYIHAITIRIDDIGYIKPVKQRLHQFNKYDDVELEILDWSELMPELVQFIVMDDIMAYIFDFILFMIVAFGILNTIQMSVFERTREFGVMLSIGTAPRMITSVVLIESVFISLIGITIGTIAGTLVSYYFTLHPMDFAAYAEETGVWGVTMTTFPAKITWKNLTVTMSSVFVLGVLFSYFPARRAAKLKPIEAIRKL